MVTKQGPNRGSFMWGTSTANTRIERLWVDVGAQFVRPWRGFFFRLERLHGLNRKNRHHLWLLHTLFLDAINDDCKEFQEYWNSHPVSGLGKELSPNDMRLLGQVQHGVYDNLSDEHHPDTVAEYGGHSSGMERLSDNSNEESESNKSRSDSGMDIDNEEGEDHGAGSDAQMNDMEDEDVEMGGSSSSEGNSMGEEMEIGGGNSEGEDDFWEEESNVSAEGIDGNTIEARIAKANEGNFNHAAVKAPKHKNPFGTKNTFQVFSCTLSGRNAQEIIPAGFGIRPDEWDNGSYPETE
ncbi:hypothetical protein DXG01_012430, partial [Tephrocybe rancida]